MGHHDISTDDEETQSFSGILIETARNIMK